MVGHECEVCGNEYDKSLEITVMGETHYFDCFECAIQALAPVCPVCDTRIIGHGIESERDAIYCCAHCAASDGVTEAVDHVRAGGN